MGPSDVEATRFVGSRDGTAPTPVVRLRLPECQRRTRIISGADRPLAIIERDRTLPFRLAARIANKAAD